MKGGDIIKERIKSLTVNQRLLFEDKLESLNEVIQLEQNEDIKSHLIAYIKGSLSKEDIQYHLKNHLPDYMIPAKFVILDEFPRLPNGKIDYNSLEIESTKVPTQKVNNPSNISEVERKLIVIWKEILNYSPLSIYDNFFEIGGDSILSIQIISKARKVGILLEANQIFEYQTIAELALHAKVDLPENDVIYTGDVNLSPMQYRYFERHSIEPDYMNLVYKLKLKDNPSSELIARVASLITERHESLRLRFVKRQNIWYAEILDPNEVKAYCHEYIDSDVPENYDKILASIQSDFSSSDTVLFKVIHFTSRSSDNASVMLMSHHLLVDNVSWKMIIEDFMIVLDQVQNEQVINLLPKSLPYHTWIKSLTDFANSVEAIKTIPYWLEQISTTNFFSSELNIESHIEKVSIETETFILDTENSRKLVNEANSSFNTKIDDLLIFVLIKTFMEWAKVDSISIGLECTGREWNEKSINPTETIGCLKSYFPLKFNLKGTSLSDGIKGVKEQLRLIPQSGLGYSVLRYFSKSEEIRSSLKFNPQILFSYLGTKLDINQGFNSTGLGIQSSENNFNSQFEIISFVVEDKLHISWNYYEGLFSQKTIKELIAIFEVNLKSVIEHCTNVQNIEYTPSDFPESGLNESELNNLLDLFN